VLAQQARDQIAHQLAGSWLAPSLCTVARMRESVAFAAVGMIFDRAANALGSTREERGLLVCALVLGSLYLIQRSFFAQRSLVLRRRSCRGLLWSGC
jgi:hypothetical protein